MKDSARSYMWWSGIDSDIEQLVRACTVYQQHRRCPPPAPSPDWERPTEPWNTIHVDSAGPIESQSYLIVVDVSSKWLEVRPMKKTTSAAVVQQLRHLFATFGIPHKVVSDNGSAFTSAETKKLFDYNGIAHYTSAPYYPSTNGQAERMVAELKTALKRARAGPLDPCLARFLFKQRTTISTSTGKTPAFVMFGRDLPSPVTALKPRCQSPSLKQHQLLCKVQTIDYGLHQELCWRTQVDSWSTYPPYRSPFVAD